MGDANMTVRSDLDVTRRSLGGISAHRFFRCAYPNEALPDELDVGRVSLATNDLSLLEEGRLCRGA